MAAASSTHRNFNRHIQLDDNRLHLHNGPIDLIIQAWGPDEAVLQAYENAKSRFTTILDELVEELDLLRTPWQRQMELRSPVARRMQEAVAPFGSDTFVTPMAAVAGAVADEILAVMTSSGPLDKAYVNNGGDIAVLVTGDETLKIGLIDNPDPRLGPDLVSGRAHIRTHDKIGGIATSGRFGRSFSLGIADAVTVVTKTAASADVAATLIANAVNIISPGITRVPATDLDPDSDLGSRLVTTQVGDLIPEEIETALGHGLELAEQYSARNLIDAALLRLKGQSLATGAQHLVLSTPMS
ncbi:MAG: UPF0280 family protein [Fimbriimonadaceae bacterium]|nr:UPF0280 family protein [Alphaproteobacteria bacterium]